MDIKLLQLDLLLQLEEHTEGVLSRTLLNTGKGACYRVLLKDDLLIDRKKSNLKVKSTPILNSTAGMLRSRVIPARGYRLGVQEYSNSYLDELMYLALFANVSLFKGAAMSVFQVSDITGGASTNPTIGAHAIDTQQNTEATTLASAQRDTAALSPDAQAVNLYQQGESVSTIANVMGTSIAAINGYLSIPAQSILTGETSGVRAAISSAKA
jgi:hypothetical protein